jgi:hypothetical protein
MTPAVPACLLSPAVALSLVLQPTIPGHARAAGATARMLIYRQQAAAAKLPTQLHSTTCCGNTYGAATHVIARCMIICVTQLRTNASRQSLHSA